MSDAAQKSPFARLDTSLMRSTKPQPEADTDVKNKETSFQVTQETRKLENKFPRKQGNALSIRK